MMMYCTTGNGHKLPLPDHYRTVKMQQVRMFPSCHRISLTGQNRVFLQALTTRLPRVQVDAAVLSCVSKARNTLYILAREQLDFDWKSTFHEVSS